MDTVTLGQAIRNAIAAERSAERFYTLLAESTDDPEASAFLGAMAAQEAEHALMIEQMGERINAGELPERPDTNVEVIETAPDWAYVDGIQLDPALEMALELENHALLYYEAFAESLEGPVGEFYEEIAAQEHNHVKHLEKMIRARKQAADRAAGR